MDQNPYRIVRRTTKSWGQTGSRHKSKRQRVCGDGGVKAMVAFVCIKRIGTRTTIKDTWTELRGRVEAGEGGGFGWGGEMGRKGRQL